MRELEVGHDHAKEGRKERTWHDRVVRDWLTSWERDKRGHTLGHTRMTAAKCFSGPPPTFQQICPLGVLSFVGVPSNKSCTFVELIVAGFRW